MQGFFPLCSLGIKESRQTVETGGGKTEAVKRSEIGFEKRRASESEDLLSGDYSIRRTGQELAETLWVVSRPVCPSFFLYFWLLSPSPIHSRQGPVSSCDPDSQAAAPISTPVCSFFLSFPPLFCPVFFFLITSTLHKLPQTSRVASIGSSGFPLWLVFGWSLPVVAGDEERGVYTGDQLPENGKKATFNAEVFI